MQKVSTSLKGQKICIQVDLLEEQLLQARSCVRDAKAEAETQSDELRAHGHWMAREAQQLLDLGADVRVPSHTSDEVCTLA